VHPVYPKERAGTGDVDGKGPGNHLFFPGAATV